MEETKLEDEEVDSDMVANDCVFMGHEIKKGEVITLCLASANRDERQFDRADELILDRSPNRHIAFGSGIHFCLGGWLAKKQAQLSLQYFLQHFPEYEIVPKSVSWADNLSIRSLNTLKVTT